MTIYGWDLSHYDTTPTVSDCHLAIQQGIVFATHKLGEGMTNIDRTATQNYLNWRNAGLTLQGGYYFGRNSDDPKDAARQTVNLTNQLIPQWASNPGWFFQADCETETGQGKPSVAWIKTYCDELASLTKRLVIAYASHGEYGSIPNLGHPLWNANYGSEKTGEFKAIYPGDSSAGWAGYPDVPLILQYSSKANIAGHTTCDANAYRGTLAELTALIEGGHIVAHDPLDAADANMVWHSAQLAVGGVSDKQSAAGGLEDTRDGVAALQAAVTALGAKVDANQKAVLAAIAGISGGTATGDVAVSGTLRVAEPS